MTLPASIRKAGLFTPPLQAMVGYFKARCHMSYSTLRDCLAEVFGLPVCAGYLTKVCTKSLSMALQPAYAEVANTIRHAVVLGTDETGHKVVFAKRAETAGVWRRSYVGQTIPWKDR